MHSKLGGGVFWEFSTETWQEIAARGRRSEAGWGTIAAAVWEGRRFAEEIEDPSDDADATPYRREVTRLARRT